MYPLVISTPLTFIPPDISPQDDAPSSGYVMGTKKIMAVAHLNTSIDPPVHSQSPLLLIDKTEMEGTENKYSDLYYYF